MKISERFKLGKSQAELDFVDIDTSQDTPLFLDPFFLGQRTDNWSVDATLTIRNFFENVISAIRNGDKAKANLLFDYLHETNATCLGLSNGQPDGNGVGQGDTSQILQNLLKSKAVETGLIQDIEDNILFVDNFGKDKLSDMTTNIINRHLILYTQSQCILHNIPLTANVPSGFFWSPENEEWQSTHTNMLVVNHKPILLVPKAIVSFTNEYTPDHYYNHFVLNYLQNEHLRMNSVLVQKRVNGSRYVTKKSLKEDNPNSKDFLRKFTLRHPEVLEDFKTKTKKRSVKNIEIGDVHVKAICKRLGEKLIEIKSGTITANDFHNIIIGILELLFYPILINPIKEREIHDGRKRIDITFDNASQSGIFFRLGDNMNLFCPYIVVECKNYSADPANPELDQLSGRFSGKRGRVGLLICRTFNDRSLFIKRCQDTYKDGRGLILPLCDQDILNLLDNNDEFNDTFLETYISNLVREITLN